MAAAAHNEANMSTPYLAQEVAASLLQITGTFFLAVEAIKLENLKKFRDTVFGTPRRLLVPSVWVPKDASPNEIKAAVEAKKFKIFSLLGAAGFLLQLLLVGLFTPSPLNLLNAVKAALPDSALALVFLALVSVSLLTFTSVLCGFLLYKALYLPVHLPYRALELIEQHTASGGIGILGFVLVLVGALIQIAIKVAA